MTDCLAAKTTMDSIFGIFYAGAIIPMLLGGVTASVAAGLAVSTFASRGWGCFWILIARKGVVAELLL